MTKAGQKTYPSVRTVRNWSENSVLKCLASLKSRVKLGQQDGKLNAKVPGRAVVCAEPPEARSLRRWAIILRRRPPQPWRRQVLPGESLPLLSHDAQFSEPQFLRFPFRVCCSFFCVFFAFYLQNFASRLPVILTWLSDRRFCCVFLAKKISWFEGCISRSLLQNARYLRYRPRNFLFERFIQFGLGNLGLWSRESSY